VIAGVVVGARRAIRVLGLEKLLQRQTPERARRLGDVEEGQKTEADKTETVGLQIELLKHPHQFGAEGDKRDRGGTHGESLLLVVEGKGLSP